MSQEEARSHLLLQKLLNSSDTPIAAEFHLIKCTPCMTKIDET